MSRAERKAVQRIHEASGALLAAGNFAETYMARVELANAVGALLEMSAGALRREREKAAP